MTRNHVEKWVDLQSVCTRLSSESLGSYQPHHLATNGLLSDHTPQGSFHVSQSSTGLGMGWLLWSWRHAVGISQFFNTACVLSGEDRNIILWTEWFLQSAKRAYNIIKENNITEK